MPLKDPIARREYRRKYFPKWYAKNHAKHIALVRQTKRRHAAQMTEMKQHLSCSQCGESHPACLDFHHSDPSIKDWTIAKMVRLGYSWKRILAEVSKCVVLCSNCHRKLHAANRAS